MFSRINLEILKAAVIDSRDGITISDFLQPDNPLIFVNPAFETMTGYTMDEAISKNCRYLQKGDTNQNELDVVRTAIKNGQSCLVTLKNYRKDGTMFWNELSLSPIYTSEGTVTNFLGIQKDITSRVLLESQIRNENTGLKSSNSMLEYMVNIDPLTGLHNRRFLSEQLNIQWKIAIRNKERLAIYILDIDYFKKFNDTYGHKAGDLALIQVAKALNTSFMKSTDFVARFGGEEFIILTAGMSAKNVEDYANIIVKKISDLNIPHIASETGFLTISLGYFIISPTINDSPDRAIEEADKALYKSKSLGRNRATGFTHQSN